MATLPFLEARQLVVRTIAVRRRPEPCPLDEAHGRVLAADVSADRDQPPFDRVTRDGYAVRAVDLVSVPAHLRVVGEAPPGRLFPGRVEADQAVEIMTGAPLPAGADAVVMVEYTVRDGDTVRIDRTITAGENVVPRGSELRAGVVAHPAGRRLDPAAIGLLASLGCAVPSVHARPRVAIVATGDELVDVTQNPTPTQIRNSNRHALAAQVLRAGGLPQPAPIARDDRQALRAAVEQALVSADLLLLSGGVSMGKYDFVEGVLAELGGRALFDGVEIRPGRPLVFGEVRGTPFFGLPGNPLSTLVTFELFVRPALDLLGGADGAPLRYTYARLGEPYRQRKAPLTVFVPAILDGQAGDTVVRPLPSQGSADLGAMARAGALMVVEPGLETLEAGVFVPVLPK